MKTKIYYFTLAILCLNILITGCKDKDKLAEPKIEIEKPEFTLSASGDNIIKEIAVVSNYDWTASVPQSDDWCTVEKKGKDKIKVSLLPNPKTESRQTKITIESGYEGNKKNAFITIKQEAGDKTTLSLNVEELVFSAKGETKQIEILSNQTDWTASVDKSIDWISFEKNDEGFLVTTKEHTGGEQREAEAIIKAGVEGNQEQVTLKVTQFGTAPTLRLTKNKIEQSAEKGEFEIEVVTNQSDWRVNESVYYEVLDEKWCTPSKSDNKLIIKLSRNVKTEARSAKVFIHTGEGPDEISDTLYIEQAADAKATLEMESQIIYPKTADTHILPIKTNRKNWKYEIVKPKNADWITFVKKENALEVKVTENKDEDRSIEINITAGVAKNTITKIVKITQQGGKASIYLASKDIALDEKGTEQTIKVTSNTEWTIFVPEEAKSWCTVKKKSDNELSIKATEVESGSRSVVVKVIAGAGDNYAEAELRITQNKVYKVGDYYVVNGEKLGIVFKVTDGGKHGKVFSLDAMKEYKPWLMLRAAEKAAGIDLEIPIYGATSRTDGLSNTNILKQKEPNSWRTRFPVLDWIDKKNKAQNNPGWYWPAIEECGEIAIMFAGEKNESEVTPESKKHRDKINKLLTDAGGDLIDYTGELGSYPEEDMGWIGQRLMSSTEEMYQKHPNYWQMYLGRYWEVATFREDHFYNPDTDSYSDGSGSVRAVLKF